MTSKKEIDRDATGKVYDVYDGKELQYDNTHPIYQYISIDEILRQHIIINDKSISGVLFIDSDRKFHVISLPQVGMDGFIYGTMGTLPVQYLPIKLPADSLQDIITLIDCSIPSNLDPFKVETIETTEETPTPFTATANHKLIRVPKLIPLPGYHMIDGGSIDDPKARESIMKLHPAIKG